MSLAGSRPIRRSALPAPAAAIPDFPLDQTTGDIVSLEPAPAGARNAGLSGQTRLAGRRAAGLRRGAKRPRVLSEAFDLAQCLKDRRSAKMTIMNDTPLSSNLVREALGAVDQAIFSHQQWQDSLLATLVCRLQPDTRDIASDAHKACRFGQWYYGRGAALLGRYAGFLEVEAEHRRMHEQAGFLLTALGRGEPIKVLDYERYRSAVKLLELEMQTLKRQLEDDIYNLDPLTGAGSRVGILTKLREQWELGRRAAQSCCLVMMDLDHFKRVNDTYGHPAGDRVLMEAAKGMMATLRPYDRLFRYGGEEFLICMPSANLDTGLAVAERLGAVLRDQRHEADGHGSFSVTASFGVTLLDPDVPVETSIERADQALYEAKRQGRDRAVVWVPGAGGDPGQAPGPGAEA